MESVALYLDYNSQMASSSALLTRPLLTMSAPDNQEPAWWKGVI